MLLFALKDSLYFLKNHAYNNTTSLIRQLPRLDYPNVIRFVFARLLFLGLFTLLVVVFQEMQILVIF